MIKDVNGDKVFEDVNEAMHLVGDWSYTLVSWIKSVKEEYGVPFTPHYRTKVLDLANVTKRFISVMYNEILRLEKENISLREKLQQISEDSLCPRCGGPRYLPTKPTP